MNDMVKKLGEIFFCQKVFAEFLGAYQNFSEYEYERIP